MGPKSGPELPLDSPLNINNELSLTPCLIGSMDEFNRLLIFSQNQLFSENSSRNTFRVSNSLDPDQTRHFVLPGPCLNYFQQLLADDTSR